MFRALFLTAALSMEPGDAEYLERLLEDYPELRAALEENYGRAADYTGAETADYGRAAGPYSAYGRPGPPPKPDGRPDRPKKRGKPNIMVVMVDDWGHNDVGFEANGGLIKTPVIDNLATKEGILLTRHYSYNWCSPARSSIMTGRLPVHVYYKHVDAFAVNPANPGVANGAPSEMAMISDKMKSAGYRTVYHGKWGVGFATKEHLPLNRGYDEFYGYLSDANDYWTKERSDASVEVPDTCTRVNINLVDIWEQDKPSTKSTGKKWEDFLFEEATLEAIENHDTNTPLFLFHAFHSCHTPLNPPLNLQDEWYPDPDKKMDPSRRAYATMVTYVDTSIGKMVESLKKKEMWHNTIMLVVADNGGPIYAGTNPSLNGGADNYPLRGGKTSDWEGGIRVRTMLTGGWIPKQRRGITLDGLSHFADWLSTFSTVAGYDPRDPKAVSAGMPGIDSLDLMPYILGQERGSPRQHMLVSDKTAIKGDYKITFGNGGSIMPTWSGLVGKFAEVVLPNPDLMKYDTLGLKGYGQEAFSATLHRGRNCTLGCLFDLGRDPQEIYELSDTLPNVKAKMTAYFKRQAATIWNPNRGSVIPGTCERLQDYGGFYAPFYPQIDYDRTANEEMGIFPGILEGPLQKIPGL